MEQMVNWEGTIQGRQVTCALQFMDSGKSIYGQGRDDEGHNFSLNGKVKKWSSQSWKGTLLQNDTQMNIHLDDASFDELGHF